MINVVFKKFRFKVFYVNNKTQGRRFQIKCFWKAAFSWRIRVDGRPNHKSKLKLASSNFPIVMLTGSGCHNAKKKTDLANSWDFLGSLLDFQTSFFHLLLHQILNIFNPFLQRVTFIFGLQRFRSCKRHDPSDSFRNGFLGHEHEWLHVSRSLQMPGVNDSKNRNLLSKSVCFTFHCLLLVQAQHELTNHKVFVFSTNLVLKQNNSPFVSGVFFLRAWSDCTIYTEFWLVHNSGF